MSEQNQLLLYLLTYLLSADFDVLPKKNVLQKKNVWKKELCLRCPEATAEE